jgi:hypothetical protein
MDALLKMVPLLGETIFNVPEEMEPETAFRIA